MELASFDNLEFNFELFNEYVEYAFNGINKWWSLHANEIYWQLVIFLCSYLFLCLALYILLKFVNTKAWQIPGPPKRVLIVTAHPDDEVMFFGPLIYWLVSDGSTQIYLLCLSMGGHKRRKDELWACANRLGIPEANITIIMNSDLPDDSNIQWQEDVVAACILKHIESLKINALVTFDKYGVSKHKNHISLYYAVASLCIEKKVPAYCKMYTLESINIFRKYIQILDMPISLLSSFHWYMINYEQRKFIKHAMKAHESQYVWFRKLYMMFSRYTMINTFQEVNILDLELDLQVDYEDN